MMNTPGHLSPYCPSLAGTTVVVLPHRDDPTYYEAITTFEEARDAKRREVEAKLLFHDLIGQPFSPPSSSASSEVVQEEDALMESIHELGLVSAPDPFTQEDQAREVDDPELAQLVQQYDDMFGTSSLLPSFPQPSTSHVVTVPANFDFEANGYTAEIEKLDIFEG
jgi:hypothetical protein